MKLKLGFLNKGINIGSIGGGGGAGTTTPTFTIEALSAAANVVSMQITASEEVTGFEVGDITVSAGGSLANFATADNIVFTVSWTLAADANTLDIAAGVCTSTATGGANLAASQFGLTYLILQPDGSTGLDARIYSGEPDTNIGTQNYTHIGAYSAAGVDVARTLIKFDLSSIPAGRTIFSSVLSLYCIVDFSTTPSTYSVYRMLQPWVETQCTWNVYSTGNAWSGGAGAFGASDCEQSAIGTRNFTASETINEFKSWTLDASAIQTMLTGGAFTNNGFLIKGSAESTDMYEFSMSEHVTAGNRPKLEIVFSGF